VFTFDALSEAYHNAKLPSEREHVTPYIINNKKFKHGNVKNPVDISGFLPLRWTVDYIEDYKLIREIYNNLYLKNPWFRMKDILRLMKEKPELQHINCHIPANEGYQKSLEEDKKFLEERKA
jgi:spore coat polysaccharide biosynthesis protein SpsF